MFNTLVDQYPSFANLVNWISSFEKDKVPTEGETVWES